MKNFYSLLLALYYLTVSGQDYSVHDSITTYQTAVAFNSILDGQPGTPKQPAFSLIAAIQEGAVYRYQASFEFTPVENGFLRNALIGLIIPSLNVGEGITDFEKSFSTSWLQRWVHEHEGLPTISTDITVQFPYDQPGEKTDLVTTLILAKNIGKGVGYFNTYAETTDGFTTKGMSYGGLIGYKVFLPKQMDLFFDILYQSGDISSFEFSLQKNFPKGWTIGPGIELTYDHHVRSASIGLGVVLFFQTSNYSMIKKKV